MKQPVRIALLALSYLLIWSPVFLVVGILIWIAHLTGTFLPMLAVISGTVALVLVPLAGILLLERVKEQK